MKNKSLKLTNLVASELNEAELSRVRGGNDYSCGAGKGKCQGGNLNERSSASVGSAMVTLKEMRDAELKFFEEINKTKFRPMTIDTLKRDTTICKPATPEKPQN